MMETALAGIRPDTVFCGSRSDVNPAPILWPLTEVDAEKVTVAGSAGLSASTQIWVGCDKRKGAKTHVI